MASVFVALTVFGLQVQLPSWWASATRVSGLHIGALFGLMNMVGGIGRLFSQYFLGWFADWRKSLGFTGRAQWDPALYVYVGIALSAMIFWILINPEKTVERPGTDPARRTRVRRLTEVSPSSQNSRTIPGPW